MGVQNENNVEGSKFESAMNGYSGDTTKHLPTSEWEKMSAMARGELINDNKPTNRPSKDDFYLNTALAYLQRSTCLRRKYAAVIINNDVIVAAGYNGSPRGIANCCDTGKCYRKEHNIPAGEQYEACVSVHAEQNAIINAGRERCIGATLYLTGIETDSNEYTEADCCVLCKRAIKNAGIEKVIFRTKTGGVRKVNVSDWGYDDLTIKR